MANDATKWTMGRARMALQEQIGRHRAVWLSCSKKVGIFWVHVWENAVGSDSVGAPPVHIGRGHSADRSEAIRMAMEDALARLRQAGQERAEELAESWLNGNRRAVLGELWKMPGFVAAAAALTIAQTLPERERSGFTAAVLLAGEAMAPRPKSEAGSDREVLKVSITVRG